MSIPSKIWSFVLLLTCTTVTSATTCYFPNHNVATNFTACNAAATQSHCCRPEDACLSNGYCLQQTNFSNRIIRGACTDQTFSSAACPTSCRDVAPNVPITMYLAFDESQGAFCCANGYNVTSGSCQTPTMGSLAPFNLDDGVIIIDRADGTTLPSNWTKSGNGTSVAVTTVTATPTTAATTQHLLPIAAGIAVPLGICLFAALVGCVVLWNQSRNLKKKLEIMTAGSTVYTGYNSDKYGDDKGNVYSHVSTAEPHYAGYHRPQYQASHLVEAPSSGAVLVEAPTERQVVMADSRNVSK